MFKVSVKGIVADKGRYLLRINERGEYELLGGKLERADKSLADRVKQELVEESGVVVEPAEAREPWFYVIGGRPVLIVPLLCTVVHVPARLFDQDGGRLEWVEPARLGSIKLPASYVDSIRGTRPRLTTLDVTPGPSYADDKFDVELVARSGANLKRYVLSDACDFHDELRRHGYEHATFAQVGYGDDKRIHVVFDVTPRCGCPSPRQTGAPRSANQ